MTAAERRNEIKMFLAEATAPVSASVLAAKFSVSRQVIVGDIALLRTAGEEISATPRGYVVRHVDTGVIRQIVCLHDDLGIIEELNTIVDYGCKVLDVIVDHPVYGALTGELNISTRYDVSLFHQKITEATAQPLSVLTGGIHLHTLSCPDEESFRRVERDLRAKGILIESMN